MFRKANLKAGAICLNSQKNIWTKISEQYHVAANLPFKCAWCTWVDYWENKSCVLLLSLPVNKLNYQSDKGQSILSFHNTILSPGRWLAVGCVHVSGLSLSRWHNTSCHMAIKLSLVSSWLHVWVWKSGFIHQKRC